jgi:hypothetical protein
MNPVGAGVTSERVSAGVMRPTPDTIASSRPDKTHRVERQEAGQTPVRPDLGARVDRCVTQLHRIATAERARDAERRANNDHGNRGRADSFTAFDDAWTLGSQPFGLPSPLRACEGHRSQTFSFKAASGRLSYAVASVHSLQSSQSLTVLTPFTTLTLSW